MAEITAEAEQAKAAGLRYVDDSLPGITRRRLRSGFAFYDVIGKRITDNEELARIRSLAVPPAYESVWICANTSGHIQATARDARGRKQYRYHKRWREFRDANKFESTIEFGNKLPALRARVEADLALSGMSREKVIATVVRILDDTLIRIGNEAYARENASYGLTTLRSRHVHMIGDRRIRLKFRGKSGVEHAVTIEDRRVAKVVMRCRDLPGELLFTFLDDEEQPQPVQSEHVNSYLRETLQGDFSAKDFRTFAASVLCAVALEKAGEAGSESEAKSYVARAIEVTAKKLGNTPAVCRKSYVHPAIIEAYLKERKLQLPRKRASRSATRFGSEEQRVLAFLEVSQRPKSRLRKKAGTRLRGLNRSPA